MEKLGQLETRRELRRVAITRRAAKAELLRRRVAYYRAYLQKVKRSGHDKVRRFFWGGLGKAVKSSESREEDHEKVFVYDYVCVWLGKRVVKRSTTKKGVLNHKD